MINLYRVLLLAFTTLVSTSALHAQLNTAVGPYFNGIFPSETPGPNGAWEVGDLVPDLAIPSPLKILDMPGMNRTILVLSKNGEVYTIDLETLEQRQVLDIIDRTLNAGEGGAVGMAIHPEFATNEDRRYIFIYYRHKPGPGFNKGFNRLSKFQWNPNLNQFDPDSETILIQQYDDHIWHNGGSMFFDNDGLLYLSVGDEGQPSEVDITQSTQRIDKGFFSGILRIDVDNDPSRSHPTRRQPQAVSTTPDGWGETYSQGYSIPNDNPWISEDGDHLEEFYAIGLRAPYTTFYDPLSEQIWAADVGSDKFEEINLVDKGTNHQWPYIEGEEISDTYEKPNPLIGEERPPYYYYARDVGTAIVGGGIYRGNKFPSLDEKLIFGDYVSKKIMIIDQNSEEPPTILIESVSDFGITLPDRAGIAFISIIEDGSVLLSIISGSDFEAPGKILYLKNKSVVADPPSLLSEIGVFKNMSTREVVDEFLPYEVNSPLWSDGAIKTRFVAIPNDGTFDAADEQIQFSPRSEWKFPNGTVFLKHFELQLDLSDPASTVPVETRFFITGDAASYGLTYKWNDEGTEAYLQQSRSVKTFNISDNGTPAYSQVWDYPSRSNCMRCHNSAADFVLGLNTLQMNRNMKHPSSGIEVNQLEFYNDLGAFSQNIGNPAAYPRGYPLQSNEASLDVRIRAYMDANCSYCHRQDGPVNTVDMDLRFHETRNGINLIRREVESMASTQDFIIAPGDHTTSELWLRDETRNANQMPPLATNVVDRAYIDSLAVWIDGMSQNPPVDDDIFLGPNPITDYLRVDVGPKWAAGYTVRIVDMKGVIRMTITSSDALAFIDLSHFESGAYILQVEGQENLSLTKKIIILD